MNLVDLIPAPYRWLAAGLALAAATAAAGGAAWWVQGLRLDLQVERAARLAADLQRERETVALQAGVLVAQQSQIGAVSAIDQRIALLAQRIDRQGAEQRQAFKELSRDPIVLDYLDLPVPAAVGMHYSRPETTDPGAYRPAPALHSGAVPAARPGAAADKR